MKKLLLYIFLGLALPMSVQAFPAKATIYSEKYHKIRVSIDGHLINKQPRNTVQLGHIQPGHHHARIEVIGRNGKRIVHDRIFVKEGFDTQFIVKSHFGQPGIHRTGLEPIYVSSYSIPYVPKPAHRPVLDQSDFDRLSYRLDKARFDGDRLNILTEELRYKSLYAEDVYHIMGYFTYESSKLEVARFTYKRIIDKENIHLVHRGFRFESTSRELDRFLYYNTI